MDVRLINAQELESCLYPLIQKAIEQALAKKQQPEQQDLISFKQAYALLGMAPQTLYNLVSQRRVPHSKKGKRLYFSRRELLDWVASGKRQFDP